MAAAIDLVINDGQATPVAHTFAVAKTTADNALFEDRAIGIYIGFNKLTVELKRPQGDAKSATRNLKLLLRIETPKLETVTNGTFSGIAPAPTVSYRPMVQVEATLPERCVLQDRKDLRSLLVNALALPAVVAAFEKYELPY